MVTSWVKFIIFIFFGVLSNLKEVLFSLIRWSDWKSQRYLSSIVRLIYGLGHYSQKNFDFKAMRGPTCPFRYLRCQKCWVIEDMGAPFVRHKRKKMYTKSPLNLYEKSFVELAGECASHTAKKQDRNKTTKFKNIHF